MQREELTPAEREAQYNGFLIAEYLKYGSVDEAFRKNDYNLAISYAGYHRLLDKWGIVKSAGPNKKLSEAICFFTCLSHNKVPLERMYKRMPPSFQTSMNTLHRIMGYMKEGVIRRYGTALVISNLDDPNEVLVGNDVASPNVVVDERVGKRFGDVSLPMTFSTKNESYQKSILRVLQHEVFSDKAVQQMIPDVIPDNIEPFMYMTIADISVQVFNIKVNSGATFSSHRLAGHRFIDIKKAIELDFDGEEFRTGVPEIVRSYNEYIANGLLAYEGKKVSLVNRELAYSEENS